MRIVFTPLIAGKAWNGATIYNESLGGSEAAVVYMARSIAKAGHEVTVVASGSPGKYESVTYRHYNELGAVIAEPWDVVISSRWTNALDANWNASYLVLWLHDLPQNSQMIRAHKVFCISKFQANAWHLPEDKTFITSDGVDTDVFKPNGQYRDRNKLVWTSNPDRGLPIACRIFSEIRKRWPDLELHVYGRASVYGWPSDRQYIPLDQPGIFVHDSLPRQQLARVLANAWALFYPTYWPETCCMAALEAQACGTPVITAPVGALPEVVRGGILTYNYLNAISQLRNEGRWRRLSEAGIDSVRTKSWDSIAGTWISLFEAELKAGRDVQRGEQPGTTDVVPEVVGP